MVFHLSNTTKVGKCWDLPAKTTCPIQSEICSGCYATRGYFRYKGPKKLRADNYNGLLEEGVEAWVAWINATLKTYAWGVSGLPFRIHSSGDFFSYDYFAGWVRVAKSNPNINFFAPTHNHKLVRRAASKIALPKNLALALSCIKGTQQHRKVNAAILYVRLQQPNALIHRAYVARSIQEVPGKAFVCPASGTPKQKLFKSCREAGCRWCYDASGDIVYLWH